MKKFQSECRKIGQVFFPEFTGERVYMRPFKIKHGLPSDLKRWQTTVDCMLKDIYTDEDIFIMIDQGIVQAGSTHRRGGPHIDGHWCPQVASHGTPSHHRDSIPETPSERHNGQPPRTHNTAVSNNSHGYWNLDNFRDEALILASNISACYGYVGEIKGNPKEGGDCSHLDLSRMTKIRLKANVAYSGNVTFIHESAHVTKNCERTLVRLNIPGVRI